MGYIMALNQSDTCIVLDSYASDTSLTYLANLKTFSSGFDTSQQELLTDVSNTVTAEYITTALSVKDSYCTLALTI